MAKSSDTIRIRIDSKSLRAKFDALGNNVRDELKVALQESGEHVRDRARSHHRYIDRSGNLTKATRYRYRRSGKDVDGDYVNVFIDPKMAPYGKAVHDGSKPHTIRAKRAKKLHFYWENKNVDFFGDVVSHPGVGNSKFGYKGSRRMPDDYIYRAAKYSRKEINAIFRKHLARAKERLGK